MIVDCHTHIWQTPEQLGSIELGELPVAGRGSVRTAPSGRIGRAALLADFDSHRQQTAVVDRAIVLGFQSRLMQARIPNDFVARYVAQSPEKLIGFAGIDPTEDSALDELRAAAGALGLRGVVLSPACQSFHPTDTRALRVYELAERLAIPVVFHGPTARTHAARIEYARPWLLDEVARSFPALRVVITQLGKPWIDETFMLLARHPHVFADLSGVIGQEWGCYTALVDAHEQGVIDKILFASDYPYMLPHDCIERLYSINLIAQGTNLPIVPRAALAGIVGRNTLDLLGLK